MNWVPSSSLLATMYPYSSISRKNPNLVFKAVYYYGVSNFEFAAKTKKTPLLHLAFLINFFDFEFWTIGSTNFYSNFFDITFESHSSILSKESFQILLWFSENSRKCPSMAFFNNLATFRIVNNQIFIFVYKIIPLETNSPSFKNSNTEIEVNLPIKLYDQRP